MADQMTIVQVFTPQDCRSGACDCEGAKNCKFPRCDNCDAIIGKDGKWIDDNGYCGEHVDRCPDCEGPL